MLNAIQRIQREVNGKAVTAQSCNSYSITIYIAGDLAVARQAIREYVNRFPLCVTLDATDYIYTGGLESGVRVGLINYPRFPVTRQALRESAVQLAEFLRDRLCQDSYTIVSPDNSVWVSSRNN